MGEFKMAFITDLAAACKTKPEDRGDDGFGRGPSVCGPPLNCGAPQTDGSPILT
jgi:hypothetical protein